MRLVNIGVIFGLCYVICYVKFTWMIINCNAGLLSQISLNLLGDT